MANNKFCIECGFELPITAKFCERCGFAFVLNQSTSESEPEIKQDKQPFTQPVTEVSKDGKDAIETFIQSSTRKKSRGKSSGFLKFIIILTIMTISGAIGGFFGAILFGGMGAAVGGIGSWILARIIAYPIAERIFPHRFEAEVDEKPKVEFVKEPIKLSKEARDYKEKRSGSGCATIAILFFMFGVLALLIFSKQIESFFS